MLNSAETRIEQWSFFSFFDELYLILVHYRISKDRWFVTFSPPTSISLLRQIRAVQSLEPAKDWNRILARAPFPVSESGEERESRKKREKRKLSELFILLFSVEVVHSCLRWCGAQSISKHRSPRVSSPQNLEKYFLAPSVNDAQFQVLL